VALYGGDVDGSLQAFCHLGNVFLRPRDKIHDLAGVFKKGIAGGRQPQTLGRALKQRGAEFLLQIPDLPAQGRLGDLQLLRGACDVQVFRYSYEIVNVSDFQDFYPFCKG
jgi:hypothetical protein